MPAPKQWQLKTRRLVFDRPHVVGVLNVTPDSFSDGGLYSDPQRALDRAACIREAGADLLEIGGESTRPGALPLDPEEEWRRIIPVLAALAQDRNTLLSLDTRNPTTAQRALDYGIEVINDVGMGRDPALLKVVADSQCGYVLMHSRGTPATMMGLADYSDPVEEVLGELLEARDGALEAGITPERICLDPGFGFAKLPEHNYAIFRELDRFSSFPLMIGVSRKRMLREIAGEDPEKLKAVGLAAAVLAVQSGADLVRTHEAGATVAALKTLQILGGRIKIK